MDRPHILFNAATGKYVCWLKIMNPDGTQSMTILTADQILGPYTKVRENFRPHGMSSGDFDLAVDENGKAYYYFERVHSDLISAELTDDYLDVTAHYSTHFPHSNPPFVREAPAHFFRNGRHYLLTSGTTGYRPNPSEAAIATDWHGPFQVLGDPHPGDPSRTSFHSQISCVFRVRDKKDLYIACGDRWLPEYMDAQYPEYAKMYEALFDPSVEILPLLRQIATRTGQPAPDDDPRGFIRRQKPIANTRIADYVWLPIRFDGEMPILDWHDSWSLDDYE